MFKKIISAALGACAVCALSGALAACATHECTFGEWKTVTEPTCTQTGMRERVCTDPECNEKQTERIDIYPAAHKTEPVAATPAGCTTDGNVAYDHCTLCGKNFDEAGKELSASDLVIPAAHKTVKTPAVPATEHVDGAIAYEQCEVCDKYFDGEGKEITAAEIPVPATHTDYDRQTTYCETCGEYVITTVTQFKAFRDAVNGGDGYANKTVSLGADLDLANEEWQPISNFEGTFDGKNHTIKNLKISSGEKIGLFGDQWQLAATIKNFTVDGADITGTNAVSVVLGNTASTRVEGVTVKNAKINANHWAGGVVGYAYTNIYDCHVDGLEITCVPAPKGDSYDDGDKAGGIVGYFASGTVENCTAKNLKITGYRDLGGIAGAVTKDGTLTAVKNCAVTDAVITADQTVNNYGDAAPNAGEIIGRFIAGTAEGNIHDRVTVNVKK